MPNKRNLQLGALLIIIALFGFTIAYNTDLLFNIIGSSDSDELSFCTERTECLEYIQINDGVSEEQLINLGFDITCNQEVCTIHE